MPVILVEKFHFLLLRNLAQRFEQYFTSGQTFSHFFRQVKGRLHVKHIFWGRFCFFKEQGFQGNGYFQLKSLFFSHQPFGHRYDTSYQLEGLEKV